MYTTEAYYRAYFLARNIDVTAQLTAAVDAALLVATEYLDDNYDFVGMRTVETQNYKWPRSGAYNSEGILLESATVPDKIQQATCELAYIEQTQTNGLQPLFDGQVIKSERVEGAVDVEYDSNASEAYDRFYSKAYHKIKDLITSSTGSTVRLVRVI